MGVCFLYAVRRYTLGTHLNSYYYLMFQLVRYYLGRVISCECWIEATVMTGLLMI